MQTLIRKEEERKRIIERKLRLAENPLSIALAPKTTEGHAMVKILFGFDKAVNHLRLKAGTYIPMSDVQASMKEINGVVGKLESTTKLFGDDGVGFGFGAESGVTKRTLAINSGTYVFLPRTREGKAISLLLKRLDPMLMRFRTTCNDFSKAEKVLNQLMGVIGDFDTVTGKLLALCRMSYESPLKGRLKDVAKFNKCLGKDYSSCKEGRNE